MSDTVFLLVDVGLALLLGGAILIFLRVNKSLAEMKSGQSEFMQASADLTRAVSAAEKSVQAIKLSAAGLQESLGNDIKKAKALSDELKLITEAADNLANRIEKTLTERPKPEAGSTTSAAAGDSGTGRATDIVPKEQKALLEALKDAR